MTLSFKIQEKQQNSIRLHLEKVICKKKKYSNDFFGNHARYLFLLKSICFKLKRIALFHSKYRKKEIQLN